MVGSNCIAVCVQEGRACLLALNGGGSSPVHVIPSPSYRGLHWHVLFSVQTALAEQLGEHTGGRAAGKTEQLESNSSGTTMPSFHAEGEPLVPVWLAGKLVIILFVVCQGPKPLHREVRTHIATSHKRRQCGSQSRAGSLNALTWLLTFINPFCLIYGNLLLNCK